MLIPYSWHIRGEGRIAKVRLIIDIRSISVRTIHNSSRFTQFNGVVFYSLKILPIEASISAWRATSSSLNKHEPVGLVDNHLSKPLRSLIKISLEVTASPGGLERLIFYINCKDIPAIFEARDQPIPSLYNQGFTMRIIIPESIRRKCIRFKGMKIQQNNNPFCCHIFDNFFHHIQRFQSFEIIIAVDVILTIAKLYRGGKWVIEDHIQRKGNSDSIEFVASQEINNKFIVYSPKPMDSKYIGLESEP